MRPFNKRCRACGQYANCRDGWLSWLFFAIGLVATVAMRVVDLLYHWGPIWGKLAWYTGVGGFLLFFLYKYRQGIRQEKNLAASGLKAKIARQEPLAEEDYRRLGQLFCRLGSPQERINYFFIFAASFLALALALYFDLAH